MQFNPCYNHFIGRSSPKRAARKCVRTELTKLTDRPSDICILHRCMTYTCTQPHKMPGCSHPSTDSVSKRKPSSASDWHRVWTSERNYECVISVLYICGCACPSVCECLNNPLVSCVCEPSTGVLHGGGHHSRPLWVCACVCVVVLFAFSLSSSSTSSLCSGGGGAMSVVCPCP